MESVRWAIGSATFGALAVFSLSVYLFGAPESFLPFLLRSMTVILTTFVLVLAVSFRRMART